MTDERMTKVERLELAKVVRMRAKVAKDAAGMRAAEILADFEAQLAARYKPSNDAWRDLSETAKRACDLADVELAERCRALGIPEEFRPSISFSWFGRGENADAKRRAELRLVAKTRVEALERAARVSIDRQAADLATSLVAGGLDTADAKGFLERMPSVDQLMPILSLPELEPTPGVIAREVSVWEEP